MYDKENISFEFNEFEKMLIDNRLIQVAEKLNTVTKGQETKQIDEIKINNKHIKNIKMNEKYYGDDDYLFKIPISSFIYEFDELSTKKIEIKFIKNQ